MFLLPVGGVIDYRFGILTAPNHFGIVAGIVAGMPWAADLGCTDGPGYIKRIDVSKTVEWLAKMEPYRSTCLFLAGGDVVGNAAKTLELYAGFASNFPGWPVAYIAQDGSESLTIPETCAAVFIGGSTDWKLSASAITVIRKAQTIGKRIHIGRVNWGARYNHFNLLEGSEDFTCDGTRTRFDGTKKTMAAWAGYQSQSPLFNL